ncbi:MAG: hypothetical protein ABIO04_00510 [Ferruginibacter sp.]
MIPENVNEMVSPDDSLETNDNSTATDRDDTEQDFDVLPSNGPGLAGDDGEQVVDNEDVNIETADDDDDEDADDNDDEDDDDEEIGE